MRTLHLDYETASEVNLKTAGAHVYAAHRSTRILMLGWAFDDEPVRLWEPHKCALPPAEVVQGLLDPSVICEAANAQFERLITHYQLGIAVEYERWRCTLVKAYYLGFAGGLDMILEQAGLERKDARGGRLIHKFCTPAAANHKADWYDWSNSPEDWAAFCEYCLQDVHTERQLSHYLDRFPHMHDWDWHQYFMDQRINDRGVPLDLDFAERAVGLWQAEREQLTAELEHVSGLPKVTRDPFLAHLNSLVPHAPFDSLNGDYVTSRKLHGDLPPAALQLLDLWQMKEAKASTKYTAVMKCASSDGRARGMFQYKGASRTDRVGGRRLQLQNLKRPVVKKIEDIQPFVDCIKSGDRQALQDRYKVNVSQALGGAVRHVIAAPPGKKLVVADLSSIESVVLGWVANCPLINETFRSGKDSYKVFASQFYGRPYDQITKEQRTFCKPPVLGCFAADTEVLTDRGWVPIVHVKRTDKVFDGVEWVSHWGYVDQGVKRVIHKYGVTATPDHEFLIQEGEWRPLELTNSYHAELAATMARRMLRDRGDIDLSPAGLRQPPPDYVRTYDILNAGPRSRFVIRTSLGPMIVHNCGYMLGWFGLIAYAEGMGVQMGEPEARKAVDTFRGMYPEIVKFWRWLYDSVKFTVRTGLPASGYRLYIERDAEFLRIRLPSGRNLSYHKPLILPQPAPWDKDQTVDNFTYMGMDTRRQWVRTSAHAGGVTENIVQSIASDILWGGITNGMHRGLDVILHVHDEIGAESPEDRAQQDLQLLIDTMTQRPAWAPDMWLGADGFITDRYTKD